MLRKVVFKKHGYLQLTLSTFGAALGFFVLLAGIQFYLDLRSILVDKSQMATTDFLSIHKKVSDMSMFKLKSNSFSNDEIEEIRQQMYIRNIGPITPGLFEVSATLEGVSDMFEMNTAMYFEAVDDNFIDINPKDWHWKEGENQIPIIVPSMLLDAYNFGMAPSQNLPPITEKTLSNFHYNLKIKGGGNLANFRGNIVGFSDRLNSILVPKAFLSYANKNFQNKKPGNPTQLVIEVDDITNPELAKYLRENNYETNEEKLKGSRIKSILNICLVVFLVLGCVILFMATLTFIQYAHISIFKVRSELKTVMAIGYNFTKPAQLYVVLFAILNILALCLAICGLYWFKASLGIYFEKYYFSVNQGISPITMITAACAAIVLFAANVFSVFRLLRSLAQQLQ
jgi:hypothetical protein